MVGKDKGHYVDRFDGLAYFYRTDISDAIKVQPRELSLDSIAGSLPTKAHDDIAVLFVRFARRYGSWLAVAMEGLTDHVEKESRKYQTPNQSIAGIIGYLKDSIGTILNGVPGPETLADMHLAQRIIYDPGIVKTTALDMHERGLLRLYLPSDEIYAPTDLLVRTINAGQRRLSA